VAKLRRFARSPYWYAEGRDGDGKRWCESTKQTARDAAARVARRIELERAVPRLQPLALSEALDALYAHKQRKRVSAAELQIVSTKGARLLFHFGPGFNCNALDRARVDGYVDARRADGVTDSTIGKELHKLFEALKLAGKRWGGDIAEVRTTVLAPSTPRERWLDDHEYAALLAEVAPHRRDYVIAYCNTGARYSELYRIEARHLDHAGRRVWILGRKGDAEHRERWVSLSPAAYDVLAARAKARPHGPLFAPWRNVKLNQMLQRACRRAGIAPVSANDLRRTFASWCCRHGMSERECQKFMGHSPASLLVRKVYAQLAPEAGRSVVDSFPRPAVSQVVSQTGRHFGGQSGGSANAKPSDSRRKHAI
jgi:integrase